MNKCSVCAAADPVAGSTKCGPCLLRSLPSNPAPITSVARIVEPARIKHLSQVVLRALVEEVATVPETITLIDLLRTAILETNGILDYSVTDYHMSTKPN